MAHFKQRPTRKARFKASMPVLRRIRAVHDTLVELAREVPGALEVVPCGEGALVLVGKPPGDFQMIWVTRNGFTRLDEAAEAGHVPSDRVAAVREHLRTAYQDTSWDVRHMAELDRRPILVTESDALRRAAREAVGQLLA